MGTPASSITWPTTITACDTRSTVEVLPLARGVAEDHDSGDDEYPPQFLLKSAREVVDVKKLARLVEPGECITPAIARSVVDASDDDVIYLGSLAWGDTTPELPFACSCRGPLCAEHAALVLVVGVLLYERALASA